ncbi:hypothetical protein [Calothrix sp. UHCC 0171]|uniref:hypothetical protein n=1 Tax=Calothrix sp. UHCC 0171 TaxID=3110245 RepID=UPI002B1F932B|nr:hypothetical protein [Calothrix sp. UHCC 0171]MEA5574699.1 hypothetical protein [Calothrix sp. UHCC 0171]
MKRLIIASLSTLTLSSVVLPAVRANQINTNNKGISPTLIAQNQKTSGMLMATADDGAPRGFSKERWLTAKGEVSVSPVNANNYKVTLKASGLAPNGLYTFWWVNKKVVGMDMGAAGGTPSNEFRADRRGNVTANITVPNNNNYQILAVAYHADNKTHGQMPGEMGKVTFTHLMGKFPKIR